MICFLSIRHLAVVDAVDVELEPGLNVLTGETGAGKSIVVGALGLLVGDRASGDLVRTGEERASVQAVIEVDGREAIVRREISTQGRSRAFINEALATTAALKDFGSQVLDLHGQHEHQLLLDPRKHLPLLDAYGRLTTLTDGVAEAFERLRRTRTELDEARGQDRDRGERAELLRFQLAEIQSAAPRRGEDAELAATRQILANAERLHDLCSACYAALYEADEAILARLDGVFRRVGELAAVDARFAAYLEMQDGITAQLEELAFFARSYLGGIDASPERLQEVERRLADLERLKKKYGPALEDVLTRAERAAVELDSLETASERLAALEAELEHGARAYLNAARALSRARRAAASELTTALQGELADLAMGQTRVEVRFPEQELPPDRWSETGIDEAEFYFSANPGEEPRPLARIASGGELSRVMLGLKTLASTDATGKTLVFDEVDAGIGGQTADRVGARLRALAARFQVLVVTHLPQIAAYADTHYRVKKSVEDGRTATRIERLDGEARVEELAQLMSGDAAGRDVLAGARALLAARQRRPSSPPAHEKPARIRGAGRNA